MILFDLVSFALINLLGAMSPGPDFAVVTRYALTGSRAKGVEASFGIATALLIHAGYCSLGVAVILVETPFLFRLIQVVGSCYLGYLGLRLLLPQSAEGSRAKGVGYGQAFRAGFLTNLLNPKATFFILGVYTQFVGVGTSWWMLSLYAGILFSVALGWFSTLSFLMTHRFFKERFYKWQGGIMKAMGCLLIALALFVLFE